MADKEKIYTSELPIQDKAAFLIICTSQELLTKLGKITGEFSISMTQLQILHVLDHLCHEKLTVSTVRQLLVEDSPNVSRSINKLVEKGLAVKERSSTDQRVVHVSITPNDAHVRSAVGASERQRLEQARQQHDPEITRRGAWIRSWLGRGDPGGIARLISRIPPIRGGCDTPGRVGCKHPMVAMAMAPRGRDQRREMVDELQRRERQHRRAIAQRFG